jgi:hypothetical protein
MLQDKSGVKVSLLKTLHTIGRRALLERTFR